MPGALDFVSPFAEQDFTAEKIITDETPAEEVPEYTQYVDEKYAAELMAETESVADDDLPSTSLRKGPASETAAAEGIPEPAGAESGH